MNKLTHALLIFFSLLAVKPLLAQDNWQESIITDASRQAIVAATQTFHSCLQSELKSYTMKASTDPRAVSDIILRKCESQLQPLTQIYTQASVPPKLITRYLRKRRTVAARNLLRAAMFRQAALVSQSSVLEKTP